MKKKRVYIIKNNINKRKKNTNKQRITILLYISTQ